MFVTYTNPKQTGTLSVVLGHYLWSVHFLEVIADDVFAAITFQKCEWVSWIYTKISA